MARFEDLFSSHFPFVWRCLRGLGAHRGDIDDLAQEVFLVAFRRLKEFREDQSPRAWLYGILRNVLLNHRRSQKRARAREEKLLYEPPPPLPRTPSQELEAQEAAELVGRLLEKVSADRRELFFLVELEGMPVVEVAELLGLKSNTAYSRLRLARGEFKQALFREQNLSREVNP